MARADRIPKYIVHRATGTARVRLGGREFSLGRAGTPESTQKYERLLAEWLSAGRPAAWNVEPPEETGLLVGELVLAYWRHLSTERPAASIHNERSALRVASHLYGDTKAREFGPKSLRAVRDEMVRRGWARSTVNARTGMVRAMFAWAVSEEMLEASVWHALQTVKGLRAGRTAARETEPVTTVAREHVEAAARRLPPAVADMVRVQLLTGMRPCEVCNITAAEIDRTGEVWLYRPRHHKTAHHGKERIVAVGARAQEILEPYLAPARGGPLFSPARSEADRLRKRHAERRTPAGRGNAPGTNRKRRPKRRPGDRYTVPAYRRAIHRACDLAGVPRWNPNQLRHTRATEIRRRYGLDAASAVLGHAKVETTQVYAERDAALALRVAREVG